jgi:hypothetical protein
MKVVSERLATPREIAEEIDEPINNFAYHVSVLAKLGCIELIQTRPAQGGRVAEHVYKATERPYFDAEAWDQLDDAGRLSVTTAVMQEISNDISEAMSNGTFCDPYDNVISRSPMVLDKKGWSEVVAVLAETLDNLEAVQGNVDERGADATETMQAKVEIIHFRSPSPARKSA